MRELTDLSETQMNEYANATVKLGNTITTYGEDTVTRPLDSDDILELQQSKLTTISNHASYEIDPSGNVGTFTFVVRDTNLEKTIERREQNDNFPDEVSPEFVLAREASWVASTINNGQHLRRNIGYVGHDEYVVEIKSDESNTVCNVVFDAEA